MKNPRLLTMVALFVTGALYMTTAGCKKGDAGPAGPAGPDSVQYSGWQTLNMQRVTDNQGDTAYTQTITANSITAKVLAQGSVIGYLLVADPVNGDSSVVNAAVAMTEYFEAGKIVLLSNTDYSQFLYRYVIIPGKISTTDASGVLHSYSSDELKTLGYVSLTKLLGIPPKGSSLSPVFSQ